MAIKPPIPPDLLQQWLESQGVSDDYKQLLAQAAQMPVGDEARYLRTVRKAPWAIPALWGKDPLAGQQKALAPLGGLGGLQGPFGPGQPFAQKPPQFF